MRKIVIILFVLCSTFQLSAQQNVSLLGSLSYTQALNDIWGYVDSLGNEYALVGTQTGVSIVDVTIPASPVEIQFIPSVSNTWRDLKVWNDYAYVTTEATTGLMIIDLRHLQDSVPFVYSSCGVGFTDAHNIYIDEFGVAYLFGSTGTSGPLGTIMLDVDTDPWNPSSLGSYTANYIHDGMVRNNIMYAGEIYAGQLSVVDVSNKSAPVVLGTHPTIKAFTHAVWISADETKAFTVDESSSAFIESFDITDPTNIERLDQIQSNPGSGVIPHNVFNINEYIVTSYYKDGITITDVSRPHNIIQVGDYDTYTQGSGNGFSGCWGVYPYLPSGNIIASDRNNGLFVLSPTYTRGCYLEGIVTDACSGLPLSNATISINSVANSDDVSDIADEYATGTSVAGTYSITVDRPGYNSQTISGVALSNGVVNFLNIQLTDTLPAMSVTVSSLQNPSCIGANDGAIDIEVFGGNVPYYFIWSNGRTTEDIAALLEGTYTVTVTDDVGCEFVQSFTITDPISIVLTTSKTNISCHGINNGSIQVTASGGSGAPYTYSWNTSPVQSTPLIQNLAGGFYEVTVSDVNGCTAVTEVEVRDPAQIVVFYIPQNTNPPGAPNGEINQLISGGIAPYTYTWSNYSTTEDISNLLPGTYFSSVVDRRGCAVLTTITIN
ncbi:MAG: choice-of-anchor B family protein [Bacteroidia bacterium]|nr:choice-of-anchor B family protein [Bacteroidia bacterium]